jgi:esterase/lipase superfamily enzyme
MGSKLTVDALQFLWESDRLTSPVQTMARQPSAERSPLQSAALTTNLLLIAPDIATKEFKKIREALLTRVRHITIYCTDDSILGLSRRVNGDDDDRLGFCAKARIAADAMPGVDFVRISGCTASTWDNHSVHLNVRDAMEDIRKSLVDQQEMGLPPPSRDREIRCDR